MNCKHNQISRYNIGFYCQDCKNFIKVNSEEYKKTEGASDYYSVFHNIAIDYLRAKKKISIKIKYYENEWNKQVNNVNYFKNINLVIKNSDLILKRYNKNKNSATLFLKN